MDSAENILPELEVKEKGHSHVRMDDEGSINMKASDISRLVRSFGEADFLNQVRQLTLVFAPSDYAAGLSVDGDDGSQAQYLIGGAPVIYPYRFGGVFSTFNTSHFSRLKFSRVPDPALGDRLGASFELSPAFRFKPGAEGSVNVGMISSSLTIRAGFADRVALSLSGRISYIDLIYGRLLEGKNSYLKYGFDDVNADMAWRVTDIDELRIGFFNSSDKVGYDDKHYSMTTEIKWKNNLFNLAYTRKSNLEIEGNIYASDFRNLLRLRMPQFRLKGPSAYSSLGANLSVGQSGGSGLVADWHGGVRFALDRSRPQWAVLEMMDVGPGEERASSSRKQLMLTGSAYGSVGIWIMPRRLKVTIGSAAGTFRTVMNAGMAAYRRWMFTPKLRILLQLDRGSLAVAAGWSQQPLHKVGFSELGLSSNFRIAACQEAPVQRAFAVSARFVYSLPWWGLSVETSAYWKKLNNQAEYNGEVMEVIDTDYDPFAHLIIAGGHNYGASVGLRRQFGSITGNISYSYGDGLRHLPSSPHEEWHSLNSEGNALKCNVAWHEGRHWEVSASWRLAEGRRYTPVEALYAIGGNIAMVYGKRNSARLPSYQRLDIGASYFFTTGRDRPLRHSVNVSVLNAYGHRNVEMQYFMLDTKEGNYSLKRIYSLFRFLPSLSYTIDF